MAEEAVSSVEMSIGQGDQPILQMRHESGSSATIYLHGATLTSFVTAEGRELLFVSDSALYNGKKAIRGGVPLVFPQFGPGDLPQHGFARTSLWTVEEDAIVPGVACAVLSLMSSSETMAIWPFHFELTLTVTLEADAVSLALTVANIGAEEMSFTALLHSYLSVGAVSAVGVEGLAGLSYVDKTDGGASKVADGSSLTIAAETDSIYAHAPDRIIVHLPEGDSLVVDKDATVQTSDYEPPDALASDVVVWNPWSEKAARMGDFGDDEYPKMLCIEPGCVSAPTSLPVGAKFTLWERIAYLPAAEAEEKEDK